MRLIAGRCAAGAVVGGEKVRFMAGRGAETGAWAAAEITATGGPTAAKRCIIGRVVVVDCVCGVLRPRVGAGRCCCGAGTMVPSACWMYMTLVGA